ncbi:MAG: uncharacterized protein A8A55_3626, partial [Amphiamblys sp. WSBS2006]
KEHVSEILAQKQKIYVGRVKQIYITDYAVRILPQMRVHEDCEVEWLGLYASEKEHVSEILAQKQKIYVERAKNITLRDYAVSILPQLRVHEDCEVENLSLYAFKKEHVATILTQEQTFYVGKVKSIT